MESWGEGGFTRVSPFSTTGVNIYKETDAKCQAIELMNLLHKLKCSACRIQEYHMIAAHNIFITHKFSILELRWWSWQFELDSSF
jgi:hypothetical protein